MKTRELGPNILAFAFLLSIAIVLGCMPPHKSSRVFIGRSTYVCLGVAPISWGNNGSYLRVSSTMTADEFSSVNVKSSWTSPDYSNDTAMERFRVPEIEGEGLAVSLQSMGVASTQQVYRQVRRIQWYNKTTHTTISSIESITFPLLLAIIHVDKGRVKNIEWDSTCKWCSSSSCACNTYYYNGLPVDSCHSSCFVRDYKCAEYGITNSTSNSLCQLNVYVVWSGTDAAGIYFKSSASRISRFSSAQVTQIVSSRMSSPATNEL